MSNAGKVRVVVRSRRVPTGTRVIESPIFTPHGLFGTEPRRVILYESRLEPSDEEAIQEGRRLSGDLGVDLEVVDLSNSNPLKRFAHVFLGFGSGTTIVQAPRLGTAGSIASDSVEHSAEPGSSSA